ncbi:MAG: MarR family winged helix-turn-helix transcriptional regulator [Frankia sp.]
MATTPLTQHDDLDLVRLLTLVERNVALRLDEVLKAHGATVEEWRVLSLLADNAGHAMNEIAEFTMLPAPTLTKVIDRMVSATLVYRRADEIDRRRVLVFASDRGPQALKQWSAAVDREHDDLISTIGQEEIDLLRALLARVSERLGSLPRKTV